MEFNNCSPATSAEYIRIYTFRKKNEQLLPKFLLNKISERIFPEAYLELRQAIFMELLYGSIYRLLADIFAPELYHGCLTTILVIIF